MNKSTPCTAIIADDEAPLRAHLERMLRKLWPELKICGQAENGRQALAMVEQYSPDIIFLDIRMPGLTGMEVAKSLAGSIHIVFVTAFDKYAVEAFDCHAIDYLLKPVSEQRLQETVHQLQTNLNTPPQDIASLLEQLGNNARKAAPLKWIRVMQGENINLTHVDEVAYFKFEDKYTTVRTQHGNDMIRLSLKTLEESLDPENFWRIHRNTIVNVAWVDRAYEEDGQLIITLKNIDDKLHVSRANKHLFRQM